MGIGVSVFLIAVGAILAWAVEVTTEGIDLNAVGVILMVVGLIGLCGSLLFWSSVSPWGARRTVTRDAYVGDGYVEERPVARRRRERVTVREDDVV